ncbi:DMT family transporter [Diaminobutyricimonas sp. LJ205]|uniref:DMT family transporter n=1 Tax=Diaminobutyricimonas sp. LJ205 TaxID=2683590 RepID=UPI001E303C8D|nr:DMT family transporter [Diaminobutyricimonas sp. LJ205]
MIARTSTLSIALQFLGMGLIWGASFLFMKVALDGVSYGQVAWSREILGAAALGIVLLISRQRLPRDGKLWLHFVVLGITNCVLPHLLFAWGEQYVSSGLASIYNAVTPIMTALVVTLGFRVESLSKRQVGGILLGIFGVLMIIGPWQHSALTGELWGQLACLAATACYGFSFGYNRKFVAKHKLPGTTQAFMNIGLAAVIMLLLTPVLAWQPVELDWRVVGSLVLLGALGTGIAYVWFYNVLEAWGPTSTSTVTYITPVVGVVLGAVLLGETFSWHEPVGAVLVLLGILLTQKKARVREKVAAASIN